MRMAQVMMYHLTLVNSQYKMVKNNETTSSTFSVTTATVGGLTLSIGASTGIITLSAGVGDWTSDQSIFELVATHTASGCSYN